MGMAEDLDPREYIEDLQNKGKVIYISPKTIKFDDGNVFTYNKDRQMSKVLSSHLDIYGKYNSKTLEYAIINYIIYNIENKSFGKTISRDHVIKNMKDAGVIDSMMVRHIPRGAYLYMLNAIFRANATHYRMKDIEEMLNKGKYLYNISFTARIRYNRDGEVIYATENRAGQFRSNKSFDKVNNLKTAQSISHLFYFWKDYSALDEILEFKITHIDSKANIKDMALWAMGFNNRQYCNQFFNYTKDLIINWNDFAELECFKKCVIVFLISTYSILIEKKLIKNYILSEEYINQYFGSTLTINKLIEFVKHLKYASICIFDQLGICPIASYSANDPIINGDLCANDFGDPALYQEKIKRKWSTRGLAVIQEQHIEGLYNKDIAHSATITGKIKEFTTFIGNDDEFEFFQDPFKMLTDPSYFELNEDGTSKKNDANVILYDDIDIADISQSINLDDNEQAKITMTSEKTMSITYQMIVHVNFVLNIQITHYLCDDKSSKIIGFIDPITDRKFMKTDANYYKRKIMIDDLFSKYQADDLKWKNQSHCQIASLIAKHCGFIEISKITSQLSQLDWDLYNTHGRTQAIARHDNDIHLNYDNKEAGTNSIYTIDINKCYINVGINKDDKWIVPCAFDTWEDFKFAEHHIIPYGEYMLNNGFYGNMGTLISYDAGPHTNQVIKFLLYMDYITYDDILKVKPVKKQIPRDTFKELLQYIFKFVDELGLTISDAKLLAVQYIGGLHRLKYRKKSALVSNNQDFAVRMYNHYTENKFSVQYIDHIQSDLIVLMIQEITPNLMTATPIWNQFIEAGKLDLNRMAHYALTNSPNSMALASNTDSMTFMNLNPEIVEKLKNDTELKNEHHMLGKYKVESTIKIKGQKLALITDPEKNPIQSVQIEYNNILEIDKNEYNLKNIGSVLIEGDGPGCGKSHMLGDIYSQAPESSKCLTPTHIASANLKNKIVHEIKINGSDLIKRLDNINVISTLFTMGKSVREMLHPLKCLDCVFVEEFYQLSEQNIYLLYLAKQLYGIKLIAGGDAFQIPSADSTNIYNLINNAFIKSQLFDGNHIHLEYRQDSCRFSDDLPDLLKYIRDTGKIPQYFADKVLNDSYDLDFYLCMKNQDQAVKIAKSKSVKICQNIPDNEKLYHDGFGFCVGMPLVCMANVRKLDKFAIYTNEPTKRQNMSLLFQAFNAWKHRPRASTPQIAICDIFTIKQRAIPKECNLIHFAEQIGLKLTKSTQKTMKHFQSIINYPLYFLKLALRAWQSINKMTTFKKKFNEYHKLQNKFTTTIDSVNIENQSVNLADGKCNIPIYLISRYFQPDYARTIDSFQGDKLTKPFGIVGLNCKMATIERLNSAFGRATSKDLIWIDHYSKNKIYKFKKYPDNVDIIPKPTITKYSHVLFYYITYNGKPVQIGSTTQTLDEQWEWHLLQIKRGATDQLHVFMQNVDHKKMDIVPIYDDPIDMENIQKTEDHVMQLVQKYTHEHPESPLLNVRRKTKRPPKKREIKLPPPLTKSIDLVEFNKIKNSKPPCVVHEGAGINKIDKIKPHFRQIGDYKLEIQFRINGKPYQKVLGFKKKGIDSVRSELEQYFQDEINKAKHEHLDRENDDHDSDVDVDIDSDSDIVCISNDDKNITFNDETGKYDIVL